MSAIAFDPWAALQVRRAARAAANPANVAKETSALAALAALAEATGGGASMGGGGDQPNQPTPARGGDDRRTRVAMTCEEPTPARAVVLPLAFPTRVRTAAPDEWACGVARLAIMPGPATIEPRRWSAFVGTAERLLHDHGPELHAARWTALDLFGMDAIAPETNPAGWGLAWLLGAHGKVLDLAADTIGMHREPDGARLAFRRRPFMARVVSAWKLG